MELAEKIASIFPTGQSIPAEFHLEQPLQRGEFLPGSMAPKIEAAITFLRCGGQRVLIGLPEALPQLLVGTSGTELIP